MIGSTSELFPTTVVGSYPQPDWLIDRDKLKESGVPRVRLAEVWRVAEPYLIQAQDDATLLAIRAFEHLGIDVITDGEMRRESYSNRFATALDGLDPEHPAEIGGTTGRVTRVPRVVGPIRRRAPVEVRDLQFLRANTDRRIKITLPGPSACPCRRSTTTTTIRARWRWPTPTRSMPRFASCTRPAPTSSRSTSRGSAMRPTKRASSASRW